MDTAVMKPSSSGIKKAIWGSPEKLLRIGQAEIECYVLEDGTRVLSGRGMQSAIGLGGEAQTHGAKLRRFIRMDEIKQFINNDLAMALANPVRFIRPGRGGIPAVAFPALDNVERRDQDLRKGLRETSVSFARPRSLVA